MSMQSKGLCGWCIPAPLTPYRDSAGDMRQQNYKINAFMSRVHIEFVKKFSKSFNLIDA